ncbi:MAG: LamG-like jellyroll fold domain-containing protein [Myxococcota bacterium]
MVTSTQQPLSTPTLYSFGMLHTVTGQSVSLEGISSSTILANSWSVSFRVRLRSVGNHNKLLTIGPTATIYLGNPVSSSTPHNNHIYAVFKDENDSSKTTTVDGQVELQLGVWYQLTMTVLKGSKNTASVMMYVDGEPFGHTGGPDDTPAAAHVGTYYTSSDKHKPALGGGVDAEFMNITFWKTVLDSSNILQVAFQAPSVLPSVPSVLKSFDFSSLPASTGLYTLNKGASLCCVNLALQLGNGVMLPDPADDLNPGGDLSQPFTVEASVYALPPISEVDALLTPVILGNGALQDNNAFYFGIAFQQDLDHFVLCAKLPGQTDLIKDTTPLSVRTWNTVAMSWDGHQLQFNINGVATSAHSVSASGHRTTPLVTLGALTSTNSGSGYSHFFLGQLQGVNIWNRALGTAELATFQAPSPDSQEGLTASYALLSTELSNMVTGRRLALKGSLVIAETMTTHFASSTSRAAQPPLHPGEDSYFNLTQLQADHANNARAQRVEASGSSTYKRRTLTSADLERLEAPLEFYARMLPEEKRESYRKLWRHNIQQVAQRIEAADDYLPGAFSSEKVGEFVVSYFHTPQGRVEVSRELATAVSECTVWRINMVAAALGTFLSVMGLGFSAKALRSAVSGLFSKGYQFTSVFNNASTGIPTAADILTAVQYLLGVGQMTSTLRDCLAGLSWWNLAWSIACIVLNIMSLFVTGGAALALVIVNLVASIASLIMVYYSRPDNC